MKLFIQFPPATRTSPFHDSSVSSVIECGVLLLGIVLRVYWWMGKGFWNDSFALEAGLRNHKFGDLFDLGFGQTAPFGFSVLGKVLGELFEWNEHVLTLPLLLAGIATLFVLRLILERLDVALSKPLFLLLFALHPSLVFYSSEFKPYGFDIFFAAVFLLLAIDGIRPNNSWLAALACLMAPLFSTASFFVLPSLFLVWWTNEFRKTNSNTRTLVRIRKSLRPMRAPLWGALATGVPALELLFAGMPTNWMEDFWRADFVPLTMTSDSLQWFWKRGVGLFQSPLNFPGSPQFCAPLNVLAFLAGGTLLVLGGNLRSKKSTAVAVFLLTSLFGILLASALKKWPFLTGDTFCSRLLLVLVPPFSCLMALGMESLFERNRHWAVIFFPICVLGTSLQLIHYRFPRFRYSEESLRTFAEDISREDTTALVLSDGTAALAFYARVPDWVRSRKQFFQSAELRVTNGKPFIQLVKHSLGMLSNGTISEAIVIYTTRKSTLEAEKIVLREIDASFFCYTATTNEPGVLIRVFDKASIQFDPKNSTSTAPPFLPADIPCHK